MGYHRYDTTVPASNYTPVVAVGLLSRDGSGLRMFRTDHSHLPCYIVIRAQGLRLMRPEKAWRPIVTVEVDRMTAYEMVLGVDGQNPNLKQGFRL